MALHRVLVVHDSPAVRETVGILLGGDYDVQAASVADYVSGRAGGELPQVLIAAPSLGSHPLPVGIAVLWVDDGRQPIPPGPSLRRQFSPGDLRRGVRAALDRPAVASAAGPARRLAPPFVPAAAARVLAEATRNALPLHLVGEAGVGKRALARAVHSVRGGTLLVVDGGDAGAVEAALSALPAGTTGLAIDHVEALAPALRQRLLAALHPSGSLQAADGSVVRVISTAPADLEDAVDRGEFPPELFYRLTVLTVRLPPLRERAADLAPLAFQLAADLAAVLGRPPVVLTDAAVERLRNYLWFGNLAELEAVLVRSIALAAGSTIDAADVLFDGARLRGSGPVTDVHDGSELQSMGPQQLDLVIHELAHEFKNPLVALKTFAHHVQQQPSGGDDQVARLTSEAVERIDRTLENLLEFTRLDTPAPQAVPLAALLDAVRDECIPVLNARGVWLEHDAIPAVAVSGDPQQLAYALANLVRSLARDLAPQSVVHLGFATPACLTVRLPSGADPLGNHLAAVLERESGSTPATPLGVAIANAVLGRNGARVAIDPENPTLVVVRFRPAADDPRLSLTNGSHGSSPRIGG